jgi:hypothetical protein
MVKSEVGCRLEITPYLTVSDAEMTGFHEEVKNLKLKIPRGTPWKGCTPKYVRTFLFLLYERMYVHMY